MASANFKPPPDHASPTFAHNSLCLPGRDYLDVEEVSAVCDEHGLELEMTGFHDADARPPEKARAQVRQQSLVFGRKINSRSETYWTRIEEVVRVGSLVHRRVRDRGPFDVINLDACGSIRRPGRPGSVPLTDTLQNLISYQVGASRTPWLLFVTLNVNLQTLHPEVLDGFRDAIRKNAEESEDFRTGAERLFGSDGALDIGMNAQVEEDGYELVRFFSLGLAKWLIHLTRETGWTVKTYPSYCYSTMPDTGAAERLPSMPSLAFEFRPPEPIILRDPFNVTTGAAEVRGRGQPEGPRPKDPSIRALEVAQGFEDLDRKLTENGELQNRLREQVRKDLTRIGYKLSEDAWAAL